MVEDASTLRISSIPTALIMENQIVTSEGLKEGQITGNLKVIKSLWDGQFGRVFQVMDISSNREFVTKEMKSDQYFAKSEVHIHRKLSHPNVIQFFEVRRENDLVYIDMELGDSCLYDALYIDRCLTYHICWQYFRDLIDGVEYLHSVEVAHHDIKPENLLIGSDGRLKIADFGLASSIERKMGGKWRGTPPYIAPEVIREELYRLEPIDIWACGIVLVELLVNEYPWESVKSSRYHQWKMNYLQDPEMKCPVFPFNLIDESALDLIMLMLKEEPNDRATIQDIKNHTWFQNA